MITMIVVFVFAFSGSLLATPVARRLAIARGILDWPDGRRKRQRSPVPLLGGAAVFLGWLVAMVLARNLGASGVSSTGGMAVAGSLGFLCLVGIGDGIWKIRVRWKLLAQAVAALPLIAVGYVIDRCQIFGFEFQLGVLAVPLTLLWYVAAINALNFIDGMDGLASLSGLCISLFTVALAWAHGDLACAISGVALGGALAGFLVFNLPPAKIYLGDAGSMVVGALLSLQALGVARQGPAGASPTVMLLLLALPLADLLLAVVRRALLGHPVWDPDRGHIHHRLLRQGCGPRGTLVVMLGVCLLCNSLAAIGALWHQDVWVIVGGLALIVALVRLRVLGYYEWDLTRQCAVDWARRRMVDLHSRETFAEMSLDEAWTKLLTETSEFPLRRMRLSMGEPDQLAREYRRMGLPRTDPQVDAPFVVQIRFSASRHRPCVLSLETDEPSLFEQKEWVSVLSLCRQLVRKWARQAPLPDPSTAISVSHPEASNSPEIFSRRRRAA